MGGRRAAGVDAHEATPSSPALPPPPPPTRHDMTATPPTPARARAAATAPAGSPERSHSSDSSVELEQSRPVPAPGSRAAGAEGEALEDSSDESGGELEEHKRDPQRQERKQRRVERMVAARKGMLTPSMKLLFLSKDGLQKPGFKLLNKNPHIYQIDNFLSDKEVEELVHAADKNKNMFDSQRSLTEDESGRQVLSADRTSSSLFVAKWSTPTTRRIEQRAAEVVGLPSMNVEPVQLVSYRPGQSYHLHHDACELDGQNEPMEPLEGDSSSSSGGTRLVTFFCYLNSLGAGQGGHTVFPQLGPGVRPLHVQPKKNSALLWCNIDGNGALDPRVVHSAMPPLRGATKLGSNIWINSKDMTEYTIVKNDPKSIKVHPLGKEQREAELVENRKRAVRAGKSRPPPLDDAVKGSPGKGKAKRAGEAAHATALPLAKKAKDATGAGAQPKPVKKERWTQEKEDAYHARARETAAKALLTRKQLGKEKRRRDREAMLNELSVISFKNIYSWMVKDKGWLCVPGQGMVSWMYIPHEVPRKEALLGHNAYDQDGLVAFVKASPLKDEYLAMVQQTVADMFDGGDDDDNDDLQDTPA
jgi:prolyl 4-hydroxylase